MNIKGLHAVRSACLRLTAALGAPLPLAVLFSLVLMTGAAWALTLYQALRMPAAMDGAMGGGMAGEGMTGMAMGGIVAAGWSFAALVTFVLVWTVMMLAMMLPAAAPMILIFASAQARRARHVAIPTWVFVAGYILVWGAAGLLVYVIVQAGTDLMRHLVPLDHSTWAPLALGATLSVAGLYQLTPLKRVCLRHCRSPFAFVALHWRDGWSGALGMGVQHGLYCLGCCWALFAVLVAVGMMSIAWMLLLTVVIFAEKIFPHGPGISVAVGVGLIVIGLLVAGGILELTGRA